MAVTDFLERGALINPDGVCVDMGGRQLTYRELLRLMYRLANRLRDLGFGVGSHAALLSGNDLTAYACTFGIMRSGMAYVPMDFRNSQPDNLRILAFSESEVLFFHSDFHEQVRLLEPQLPKLKLVVCIDRAVGKYPNLDEWLSNARDSEPEFDVPIESTAWLQTGSGTSGRFRMAMMSHRAYHAMLANQSILLPARNPVMLVAAPITHAGGGLSYRVLALGGRLILMDKPDPQRMLATIQEHGITELFLPPTVIYRVLAQENLHEFDLSTLQYLIWSAAPMSVERLRAALEVFGPIMVQSYGQTEALGIAAMGVEEFFVNGEIAPEQRLSACGRPALPFCCVKIVNENNERLPQGETGEICVRGDQIMSGYYKNPEATRETIINGWVHTGDVGFFDEEGYLHIADRKKDMIISGGFNVYPNEIEQVIMSFEAVEDCAVIGVPDEDWGEAVKAVVELIPDRRLGADEIIARCKQKLGSVKAPKSIDFVESLPRSPRGKVLKRVIRERYWVGKKRKI